jgi:hypothetical protein
MSRLLRIVAYAGLLLGVLMLAYCFSVEQTQVLNGAPGASKSRMISFFGGAVGIGVLLGLLLAYDVTRFLGDRAVRFLLFGGREVLSVPEIEQAAKLRTHGEPLEAIRVLREYLQKHPGELHVMPRIAEIYERDMRNPLAAALEFEEFLKHKLDPERWAWSAIHLSDLHIGLRQPEKAVELLRRICDDYGKTSAAIKARKRLAKSSIEPNQG